MLQILKTGMGLSVIIDYTSDLGNAKTVEVTVTDDKGINVAATSTLNSQGVEALRDALQVAEVIRKHGKGVIKSSSK